MYRDRKQLYEELGKRRESHVIAYVTGDRPGLETQIHPEVYDLFVRHLDTIGVTRKLSLFLYTRGGVTLAAWTLVNLIRQFCDEFEVIVPSKAHSAGTLICLGADTIVMTKQATLGPIDPSINTPLNPQVPGGPPQAKIPVSVEAINGFIDLAKIELGMRRAQETTEVLKALADKIHPLVLGEAYRARSQIKMLARRLVSKQMKGKTQIDNVISFLCSESGSHDYTIHRREARDVLGLTVEKPDAALYELVKATFGDVEQELELTSKYDAGIIIGANPQANYRFTRGLIESVKGGSHFFVSEGTLSRVAIPLPNNMQQQGVQDMRTFEGWRHSNA